MDVTEFLTTLVGLAIVVAVVWKSVFGKLSEPLKPRYRRKVEAPNVATSMGLMVRSHGERVIAEWLHREGIRFNYEQPVGVRNWKGNASHRLSDFYLPELGVYWEHFGLWDDPTYQRKARQKIAMYHQGGHRLVCTFGGAPSEAQMRAKLAPYLGGPGRPPT